MEESIIELLEKELPRLLKENLSVHVDISYQLYNNDYKNVTVTIEYNGEEITSYTESVRVSECNCRGC